MRCLIVLAFLGGLAACIPHQPPVTDTGTVTAVVDGDTIDVAIGGRDERVRLLGIDTPEVHVAAGTRPDCFGSEASAFVATLLPIGASVRLERDVVGRDDYGRVLAYVYRVDGTMINETIVRQGFARPLTIAPNGVFADLFVAAAFAAERGDLGLWAACGG